MAGTFTISGSSAGGTSGSTTIGPITITGSATITERLQITLLSGDNTITVPAGATAVLIEPPSSNAITLKVRTSLNSGDGGLPLNNTGPFCVQFPATPPTTVIINAASLTSGLTEITFI